MTNDTDKLAAELGAYAGEPDAPQAEPQAPTFNTYRVLTVMNPERLLGLTTAEAIALAEANGACGGALHCLRVAANRSAGGWGEVLRSPHFMGWLAWFAYCADSPKELQTFSAIMQTARVALEAWECARMGQLQGEKNYALQGAGSAHSLSVHAAQKALMAHWAGQHSMTLVHMYAELSRLSNKLQAAKDFAVQENRPLREIMHEETCKLLLDGEKREQQVFLTQMWRAEVNYRVAKDNAEAFYRNDRDAFKEQVHSRQTELQERVALWLLDSSIVLQPIQADAIDILDRLAPDA